MDHSERTIDGPSVGRPGHAHGLTYSPPRPAHDHDAHDHGHAHDPAAVVIPGFSLLRMSALERLAGAVALCALIWAGVWWAMR